MSTVLANKICLNQINSTKLHSKHAYMGPILAIHMGRIWGVQLGSAWVLYGLANMRVAQMGLIWVPYNSPIKKKEMIYSSSLYKLISLFIMHG